MRLVYVTVAALVNLLARSDAISPVVDPKVVLGPDVAPVDLVVDGHADGVNTERLWQDVREHNDSNAVQVGNEERFFGIADKVKLLFTKVRQSLSVGKAAGVAVTAASTAKAQATDLAVRLKATTDMSLIEVARRWNQLRNSPTSQMTKIKLMELVQTVIDVLTVATIQCKLAIASKYRAVMGGLPNKSDLVRNMLAAHLAVVGIITKLDKQVDKLIRTAAMFIITVQFKKQASILEATAIRFFNKLSPRRKFFSTRSTGKAKRTRFAERVTDVIVQVAYKVTKVVLKKLSSKYRLTFDNYLGNSASHQKKNAVGWTANPIAKLSELAETITHTIVMTALSKAKAKLTKRISRLKATTKKFVLTTAPHRIKKGTDPFVKKIQSRFAKFLENMNGPMMAITASIKTLLDKLILRFK
ncbi:unnamed protein product [Hyaloperonospora brassicae]|uniref:RxLR effector candidate protein n=1 Tax=Hyaloperonospora brassicae TaxID=162125 RepID=A0AAV0T2S9_HYABA|nr:unnamed protein product [Hyaloperonospora brassicae]